MTKGTMEGVNALKKQYNPETGKLEPVIKGSVQFNTELKDVAHLAYREVIVLTVPEYEAMTKALHLPDDDHVLEMLTSLDRDLSSLAGTFKGIMEHIASVERKNDEIYPEQEEEATAS